MNEEEDGVLRTEQIFILKRSVSVAHLLLRLRLDFPPKDTKYERGACAVAILPSNFQLPTFFCFVMNDRPSVGNHTPRHATPRL
jgi:hypothetical protein